MLKRIATYAGLAAVLIAAVGLIDVVLLTTPEQLEARLTEEVSRHFDADVEIDSVEHAPLGSTVLINNLRLKSRGRAGRVFFSAGKAEITINHFAFFGGRALQRIVFDKPVLSIFAGGESVFRKDDDSFNAFLRPEGAGALPGFEFRDATLRFFPAGASEPTEFGGLNLEIDPAAAGGPNSFQFSYVYENGRRLRIKAQVDSSTGGVRIEAGGQDSYLYLNDKLRDLVEKLSRGKGDLAWQVLENWDYLGAGGEIAVDSLLISCDPSRPEAEQWSARARLFLRDASMKLQEFPYRIVRMSGQVDIEGTDVTFHNLMGFFGERNEGHVKGEGRILNFVSPKSDVDLTLTARNVPLDEKLRDALSIYPDVLKMWDDANPSGTAASALILVRKAPEQKSSGVDVDAKFDGRASCAFEYAEADGGSKTLRISKIGGSVKLAQEKIAILDATGEIAGAPIAKCSGTITRPGMPGSEMDISAASADFEMNDEIRAMLPAKAREEIETAGISKTLAVAVRLRKGREDAEPSVRLEVMPRKAGLLYGKFPYPLGDVEGLIVYEKDRIDFLDVRASRGEARFSAQGSISGLSGEPLYDLRICGENVRLDGALYNAVPPDVRREWDNYVSQSAVEEGGAGRARVECRITGRGEKPDVIMDIRVSDGVVRSVHFPYTVSGVSGLLKIRPEGVYLENMRGSHGETAVVLERGEILEGKVDVRIDARNVLLGEDVRAALSEEYGKAYDSLQPKGAVDVVVQIAQKKGEELQTDVTIRSNGKMEVTYKEFPLPAKEVVTEIFIGPKHLEVRKLACKLGTAVIPLDENSPNTCVIPFDAPRFRLNIRKVEGVRIDEDLIAALPEGIRNAFGRMKARGVMDLEDMQLDFLVENERGRYDYRFKAFLHDCSLGDRPLIDRLNGAMELRIIDVPGEYADATGSSCSGLDFYIRGIHIFNLTGRIERKDAGEVSLKKPADPHRIEFSASTYGANGKTNMAGQFTFCLGDSKEFEGAFDFRGVDLAALESELSGKAATMKGKMSGAAQFFGAGEEMTDIVGGGSMDIVEADLGRLPLLFSLNQLLKVDLPKAQIVNEGHLNFEIINGAFAFKKAEFKSEAVRFVGYGQVKFDETIEMTIFSDTVLRGIPVLEDIMGIFKKSIYAAEVKGTFAAPKIGPAPLFKRITDIPEDFRKAVAGGE